MHRTLFLPVLLVVALAAGCSDARQGGETPSAPAGAQATLRPVSAAAPPPRLAHPPVAGTVVRRPGPFDDRFRLTPPQLRAGTVRTTMTVTSDVSELIDLEVTADFYDAAGRLLGSDRVTRSEGDGASGQGHAEHEGTPLVLSADPSWADLVSSAVLAVPVLVNE